MHRELRGRGTKCERPTVVKQMKQGRIQAVAVKKGRVSTTDSNHGQPIAENVVSRDFAPPAPSRTWSPT